MKHIKTRTKTAPLQPERRADRFDIELPVEMDGVQGLTRNICATGIYFETDMAQAPGSHVRFTVEVTIRGEKTKMVCEGEVVRVENKDGVLGVAVELSSSFFSDNGQVIDAKPVALVGRK
jgi:hypothetical protein